MSCRSAGSVIDFSVSKWLSCFIFFMSQSYTILWRHTELKAHMLHFTMFQGPFDFGDSQFFLIFGAQAAIMAKKKKSSFGRQSHTRFALSVLAKQHFYCSRLYASSWANGSLALRSRICFARKDSALFTKFFSLVQKTLILQVENLGGTLCETLNKKWAGCVEIDLADQLVSSKHLNILGWNFISKLKGLSCFHLQQSDNIEFTDHSRGYLIEHSMQTFQSLKLHLLDSPYTSTQALTK